MTSTDAGAGERAECLNCGAALTGPFCATCGQRDVPAFPTIHEVAGEAWDEMSGWDGRLARTYAALFRHPGLLTVETLSGRRARYVKPLRLYLTASVIYFVIAAASPHIGRNTKATLPGKEAIQIDLMDDRGMAALTAEQREAAERSIDHAPALFKPVFRTVFRDPAGFRNRMTVAMPKMFFALVPVFAVILSLFYRRRPFMQHLTFALHLHALVFLALSLAALAQFTGSLRVVQTAGGLATAFVVGYALLALRRVYGGGWAATVAKEIGLSIAYVVVFVPAIIAAVAWAVLAR
jgi:hypothetical protein